MLPVPITKRSVRFTWETGTSVVLIFFLGTPGHYAMREYTSWCKACSLVRRRGRGAKSRGPYLDVSGCLRSNLTVWKEGKFTVLPAVGIKERKSRVADLIAKVKVNHKELSKTKPGAWGCVQALELC
jgi:hypothetical protein